NAPMSLAAFNAGTVSDPGRWQPLLVANAAGQLQAQSFTAPYWNNVVPFALRSADQFRSPVGPATYPSAQYLQQARDLLSISAGLTDRQKAIAEYWADGPNSELPPGHWDLFAQFVAARDHLDLDENVKLFFALTNAIFDAGIAAWDDKATFDSVRPITAIRYLFAGQKVLAWAGPGQGTQLIDGATWTPYQPATSPTPPFPEYLSGHSTFSSAGAEILRLFTGSDRFGDSVTIAAGSSKVEPGITPASPITLSWRTFTQAADQAGMSRRYGGIHFAQGDLDGRRIGRLVADQAWAKALSYFTGGGRRGAGYGLEG
ncbi:MAG TPA: vanadium-dependent haloperoxidase, partial [Actinomycetota bacterium]|nr:vanadium-dependent haloperoxidase [Actinomycetota bacterium]